jgi:hypothetical protein
LNRVTAGYFRLKSKNRKKSGRKTDFFPLKIEKTEKKRKSGSDEISLAFVALLALLALLAHLAIHSRGKAW